MCFPWAFSWAFTPWVPFLWNACLLGSNTSQPWCWVVIDNSCHFFSLAPCVLSILHNWATSFGGLVMPGRRNSKFQGWDMFDVFVEKEGNKQQKPRLECLKRVSWRRSWSGCRSHESWKTTKRKLYCIPGSVGSHGRFLEKKYLISDLLTLLALFLCLYR